MSPQRWLHTLTRMLPVLVLTLAVSRTAIGQSATPGPTVLAPEARASLERSAGDSRVAPWQRDLMLRLAHAGTVSGPGSSALRIGGVEADSADGAWSSVTGPTRYSHSAIYDPVRGRMVVFGGVSTSTDEFGG